MKKKRHRNRHPARPRYLLWTCILLAVGVLTVIILYGRIDPSWPRVDAVPVEGKVTRQAVGGTVVHDVFYEGRYHVKFVVEGKEHSIWINTHLKGPDEQTVRDAMTYQISHHTVFRIAYNPANPDEAYWVE